MLKLKSLLFIFIIALSTKAFAGPYGVNFGLGIPYLTQLGVNYVDLANNFSAEARLNFFTVSVGIASVRLTKPEINAKWHPFQGAFFVGMGWGIQYATATATEPNTRAGIKYSVVSDTVTTTLGWLWGLSEPGFYGGFDFSYQNPYNVRTVIDSDVPVNDDTYNDAKDAGEKFGSLGLPLFTLIRVGYLF
ncbi:MAG: hypothetical protein K0R29_2418 [Pseudobdellovibrio sp.]|nr:hypothetical protein [Pseudobdellovibrio sp.]